MVTFYFLLLHQSFNITFGHSYSKVKYTNQFVKLFIILDWTFNVGNVFVSFLRRVVFPNQLFLQLVFFYFCIFTVLTKCCFLFVKSTNSNLPFLEEKQKDWRCDVLWRDVTWRDVSWCIVTSVIEVEVWIVRFEIRQITILQIDWEITIEIEWEREREKKIDRNRGKEKERERKRWREREKEKERLRLP